MAYAPAEDVFTDADAKIALAQAIYPRTESLAGTPAEVYATKTRKLPPEVVRACADLRYVPPPIEGRPPQDHALVSLLRDSDGKVSGIQLEYCDISGARTGTDPGKQTYALREHGVRDGLFHAGGSGDVAYLTEGYSAKAVAVASLGLGRVYGGGSRATLGCAAPPEATVVIVPDRRPLDTSPDALRTTVITSGPSICCCSRAKPCWLPRRPTVSTRAAGRVRTPTSTWFGTARSICGG
jgi:hypothetical protein